MITLRDGIVVQAITFLLRPANMRNMLKHLLLVACLSSSVYPLAAQAQPSAWHPPAGHTETPIWPDRVPDATAPAGPEIDTTTSDGQLIAGKRVVRLGNVATPTMTLYRPKGTNSGAAVIVFPGGGYRILAMDLEGTEVCDWLSSQGLTCVLLKYRVPNSGPYPKSPAAFEDAQRTIGLLRAHAAEWHVDRHRVGVLGFSAGGNLAAALSTHFDKRIYQPVDAADQQSCRPDFAALIYPGGLRARGSSDPLALDPHLPVSKDTPPSFLLQTEDDRVAHVESSLAYYIALKNAGVPAEMIIKAAELWGPASTSFLLHARGIEHQLRRCSLENMIAQWPHHTIITSHERIVFQRHVQHITCPVVAV